ncbi:MAG: beta-lactamase family protein [Halieaceae bacterium]|jgi:CubicO group peptidase (beta-lactamase class C family)|nr:beta-lactamase family protein [Halieaceae bacterium]
MRRVLFAVWVSLVSSSLGAGPLLSVSPESVGFSSERLQQVSRYTRDDVAAGRHAGFVTMVARHGKIVHFDAVGRYGIDNDKPMARDTLFRIYSMTKPITSVALMMLYEEGAFQMNDPVSKYLPALADLKIYDPSGDYRTAAPITIEQLLTHTAGLTYGFRADDPVDKLYQDSDLRNSKNLSEFIDHLSQLPLHYEPGTRYHYSVATDVLGAVIEKISGMSLDVFFEQRIFKPLGMNDTFFSVPRDKLSRLATNHRWDAEADSLALLPPQSSREITDVTFFSGGGGLISSAMDYMIFCEMLRRGGAYNGARILGPKTVQYMTIDHLTPEVRNRGADEYPESHLYPGQSFGLGLAVILNPGTSDVVSSRGEYSWGGAADTKFWIDPEEDLVVVLMTQLMGSPWPTRYQMKAATYQALTELGGR